MRNPAISLVLGAILLSPGLAAVNVKKKDAPVARTVVDHYKEAEPSRVSVGIDTPRLSASAILLTDVKTERRQSPQGKGSLSPFRRQSAQNNAICHFSKSTCSCRPGFS
jgi:hypothetical protein